MIDVAENVGRHNVDLGASASRIIEGGTYKDCSTIMLTPSRGEPGHLGACKWSVKFAMALAGLLKPMNQKFTHWPVIGHEVGEAYNDAIRQLLAHPDLSQWRYLCTLEDDCLPPPDGLLKLYESMEAHPEYAVIGGIYWTKGEGGQPMIYGDPKVMPKNFIPQVPRPESLQECNGMGMGFHLFRLEMFKKMPGPWFKTLQSWEPYVGASQFTQDLYFYQEAAKAGYKFACDTRIKVGHYDASTGVVW
jgi:hypothetical protein